MNRETLIALLEQDEELRKVIEDLIKEWITDILIINIDTHQERAMKDYDNWKLSSSHLEPAFEDLKCENCGKYLEDDHNIYINPSVSNHDYDEYGDVIVSCNKCNEQERDYGKHSTKRSRHNQ